MKLSMVFLFLFPIWLLAQPDMNEVRAIYEHAYESENEALKIIAFENEFSNVPVGLAYVAASKMMMANHSWNPISKYQYFVEGRDQLETLIVKHSELFELRYLRLIIQSNVPDFLGYNEAIEKDKAFLMQHFKAFLNSSDVNRVFAIKVLGYLKELNSFNNDEINKLKQAL